MAVKIETKSKLWSKFYSKLQDVNAANPLNNPVIARTMSPDEYVARAEAIAANLEDGDSILEIGGGYGGLAREILKLVDVSYTIVDNPEMLAQAKKNLGDEVKYVKAEDIKSLRYPKFTMFVAHYCLSETPQLYREYVLKSIMKNCQFISIRDFEDAFIPTPAIIAAGLEVLPTVIEQYANTYFVVEKTPDRAPRFHFTGTRRKLKRR